ncbi:hypothetical protein, partial [Vibrio cholerae]|uniref:hypothetical protein n=1 Tax=Vibrio cholerae TaxID=666 RepID=UPI001C40A256
CEESDEIETVKKDPTHTRPSPAVSPVKLEHREPTSTAKHPQDYDPKAERGEFDDDSQELDFSESQVVTDTADYQKNFGHSMIPISPYWERQK